MEKEICRTYFLFNDEIINGFKITDNKGVYRIYIYTSCEKLGNWQEFLKYNNFESILRYFRNTFNDYNEMKETDWNIKEKMWCKETLEQVESYIKYLNKNKLNKGEL